ncbi:hypothetical protein pb186bvf_010939 [Paramecium bursaria]
MKIQNIYTHLIIWNKWLSIYDFQSKTFIKYQESNWVVIKNQFFLIQFIWQKENNI